MKFSPYPIKVAIFSIFSFGFLPSTASATATLEIAIGELRDSGGNLVTPSSAWALIVSNTAGGLPGGLIDGGSMGTTSQIAADFNGVSLTAGDKGDYTIIKTGFTNGGSSGLPFLAFDSVVFDYTAPSSVNMAGSLLGLYWFPNRSLGTTLTGSYEVGGFAQSTPNNQSLGTSGTVIPNQGESQFVYFFETNFNQTVMGLDSTGLGAERFTAVAVPEISSLTLTALGLTGLLIRRRR